MALVITVNLKGQIEGRVKHTKKDKQKNTVLLSKGKTMTRTIVHRDRVETEAVQNTNIPDSIVDQWTGKDSPFWEKPLNWKKMNFNQKIASYVARFDEGYGVSYEIV